MSGLVAFGLNARILARKEERLAYQQSRAFQDMAVYYVVLLPVKYTDADRN